MKQTRLVDLFTQFIYRCLLYTHWLDLSILRRTIMSQNGFGPGGPSDKRPIMGHLDSEDFVCGLHDYVTSMKYLHPDDPGHPSDDWLTWGFEMILLDQA